MDIDYLKPKIYLENDEGELNRISRPTDWKLEKFRLHYFLSDNVPEKTALKVFFEKRVRHTGVQDGTELGWLFSLRGVQQDSSSIRNESDTKFMKQFMCTVIDKFFDDHHILIEEYVNKVENVQEVKLSMILALKSLKEMDKNYDTYTASVLSDKLEKIDNDINFVVFIEYMGYSDKLEYKNKYLNLFMLYDYKLPWFESKDVFRNTKNVVSRGVKWGGENGINYVILKNLSETIQSKTEDEKYIVDILPELYKTAENEYLKFSILYQHIEILIALVFRGLLIEVLNNHNNLEVFKLKKKLSRAMSEGERIRRILANTVDTDLEVEFVKKTKFLLRKTDDNSSIEGDVDSLSQEEVEDDKSLSGNLYQLRNTLFHNLRIFEKEENLRKDLAEINNLFEKIISSLLSDCKVNDNGIG